MVCPICLLVLSLLSGCSLLANFDAVPRDAGTSDADVAPFPDSDHEEQADGDSEELDSDITKDGDVETDADADAEETPLDCEELLDSIPTAEELCNGLDDDCNGSVDDGLSDCDPVVQMTASWDAACVLRASGTVICWGDNGVYQLGRDNPDSLLPGEVTDIDDAVAIELGPYHACAILEDATLSCWGESSAGQLGPPAERFPWEPIHIDGVSNVLDLAVNGLFTCALDYDGEVLCWGSNHAGQLGIDDYSQHDTPEPVPDVPDAIEICAGVSHACARHADGAITCWGGNQQGQLGRGTMSERETAGPVLGINDAVSLTCGQHHSCILHPDRSAHCWGHNATGALGDGTDTSRASPTAVDGALSFSMLTASGDPATNSSGTSCGLTSAGLVYCWGANDQGQLGIGVLGTAPQLSPRGAVVDLEDAIAVVAGMRFVLAQARDGRILTWGRSLRAGLMSSAVPILVTDL